VIFRLDPTGKKEAVLHKFTGDCDGNHDGYFPTAPPIMDAEGNLYGTTYMGGPPPTCWGTVFKIRGAGKETILHDFSGSPDGANPYAGLLLRGHYVYSTTGNGGTGNQGTAFSMSTKGNEAVLYNFLGGSDGGNPSSALAFDKAGNLYGSTPSGGNNCGVNGCGTVFELSPSGGGWIQKTLYVFCQLSRCADGWMPSGPLVLDQSGNIYGTTTQGGTEFNCDGSGYGCGTVFKLDSSGNETVLYSFDGGTDGGDPQGGLARDRQGNLYGTAAIGGDLQCPLGSGHGCGVIFELTP
jgi:uncharacterized repeat protein (TIGR03803 family)